MSDEGDHNSAAPSAPVSRRVLFGVLLAALTAGPAFAQGRTDQARTNVLRQPARQDRPRRRRPVRRRRS
jgi:hypothetical protein